MHYDNVTISQWSPDGCGWWHKSVPYSVPRRCLPPRRTAHLKQGAMSRAATPPHAYFFFPNLHWTAGVWNRLPGGLTWHVHHFPVQEKCWGGHSQKVFLWSRQTLMLPSYHILCPLSSNSVLFMSLPSLFPCLFVPAFHVISPTPHPCHSRPSACLACSLPTWQRINQPRSSVGLLGLTFVARVPSRKQGAARSLTSEEAGTLMEKTGEWV